GKSAELPDCGPDQSEPEARSEGADEKRHRRGAGGKGRFHAGIELSAVGRADVHGPGRPQSRPLHSDAEADLDDYRKRSAGAPGLYERAAFQKSETIILRRIRR